MSTNGSYEPKDMASPAFAQEFSGLFDAYVELRVRGVARDFAVIEAFEMIRLGLDLRNADQLGMACEVNPYVRSRFEKVLAAKVITKDLWTKHHAALALLRLIEDPRVRDTTRLNAIKELNVLCGYVTLDEVTASKIGHTLADFYRMSTQQPCGTAH